MPARRKTRLARYKNKRTSDYSRYVKLIFVFGVIFLSAYVLFNSKYWNSESKLSMAIVDGNGDVEVVTFDPTNREIVSIAIPAETQVRVSRQLGVIRIKNVWQLGVNEKIGGKLLAETIRGHFKFPVVAWGEEKALGLLGGDIPSLINAVMVPYSTNLTFSDKLNIALFSLSIGNSDKVSVNLAETPYLKRKVLVDGEEGYVVWRDIPQNIAVIFSDTGVSKGNLKVKIVDATGEFGVAEDVSELLGVLGVKVSSVSDVGEQDVDCLVKGDLADDVFVNLLECSRLSSSPEGNFDTEIVLGRGFAERF
ncbi:MAG: hypothetical protein PVJ52_00125 [Candidatus Woesebacteria bacterium]|jgi:hypothetical protein